MILDPSIIIHIKLEAGVGECGVWVWVWVWVGMGGVCGGVCVGV